MSFVCREEHARRKVAFKMKGTGPEGGTPIGTEAIRMDDLPGKVSQKLDDRRSSHAGQK
jgi:hypothetical protein